MRVDRLLLCFLFILAGLVGVIAVNPDPPWFGPAGTLLAMIGAGLFGWSLHESS
jgi:hypothetical protein